MSATEELKAQARVFARAQQRVELTTLLSNPLQRPAGWVIPIAGVPITVLLWPMTVDVWPALPAVAVSYLLAVALVFGAWLLIGQILERHAFRHAPYRWLAQHGGADVVVEADRIASAAVSNEVCSRTPPTSRLDPTPGDEPS